MTTWRTVGVAATAALLGVVAGYVLARRGGETQPHPQSDRNVMKVTPRQVKAAHIAIEARELLGEPIPPGLQRIADARRPPAREEEEYRFYARPENQTPQGRPRRRTPGPAGRSAG